MILQKTGQPVITSEEFIEKSFDIKDEDKGLILEILRSKMYKNPIGSICREIASNARDANREVGNSNPIQIIFTNSSFFGNEQTIVFKDEGPGISPERMEDVFINYGSSTKRHSNEFTGGFGLGSKTPFSYTDSFCVVTTVNGIQYTYIAAIEDQANGKIYLVNKIETKENNGTSIIIPYKKEDRGTFEKEVYKATYFWKTKPNYIGFRTPIDQLNIKVIEETDQFVFVDQNFFGGAYGLIIDGVLYPIDNSVMDFANTHIGFNIFIALKFKTGDLTISATRENVQYDEKTKNDISSKWSLFLSYLRKKVLDEINSTKTVLEACVVYFEITKLSSHPLYLIQHILKCFGVEEISIENFNHLKFSGSLQYRLIKNFLDFYVIDKTGTKKSKFFLDRDFINLPVYICDKNRPTANRNLTIFKNNSEFILIKPVNNRVFLFSKMSFKEKKAIAKTVRGCLSHYKNLKDMGMVINRYSEIPITKIKRVPKTPGQTPTEKLKTFKCRTLNIDNLELKKRCIDITLKNNQVSVNGEIVANSHAYLYTTSTSLTELDQYTEENTVIHYAHVLGYMQKTNILYIHEKNEVHLKGIIQSVKEKISSLPKTIFENIAECYVTKESLDTYEDLIELNFNHPESQTVIQELRRLCKAYKHIYNMRGKESDIAKRYENTLSVYNMEKMLVKVIKLFPMLKYFTGPDKGRFRGNFPNRSDLQNYINQTEENIKMKGQP